jgi:hypothetical protein
MWEWVLDFLKFHLVQLIPWNFPVLDHLCTIDFNLNQKMQQNSNEKMWIRIEKRNIPDIGERIFWNVRRLWIVDNGFSLCKSLGMLFVLSHAFL